MKQFLSVILILFYLSSQGQKCDILNEFSAFRGFKFGETIPDSIKRFGFEGPRSKYDKSFLFGLKLKENTPAFAKKLKSWLWVNGQFTDFNIYSLNDNRIYSFVLMKDFEETDSIQFSKRQYPQFYENVSMELINLFGNSTKEKVNKNEKVGNAVVRTWDCDNMYIELSFCPNCAINFFSLSITNKDLEARIKLEEYKN
jgi:hypothetical protein